MVEMIEDMLVHSILWSDRLLNILPTREQDDDEEAKEWEMTQIRRNEGPEKAKEPVSWQYISEVGF